MAAAMKQEEGGAMDGQPSLTWRSLGTPASELRLEWTLPTGQSFRWRQTGSEPIEFTGMVGQRAVRLRQLADDVQYLVIARGAITQAASLPASGAGSAAATVEHPAAAEAAADAAALRDYFNLGTSLAELAPGWCAACDRFAAVHPLLPGARMLRQDPVECLVQFVCSSNNHISRIGGMVERLCRNYGTRLHLLPGAAAEGGVQEGEEPGGKGEAVAAGAGGKPAPPLELFAFPTLEQLAAASEEALRADGYGYRAKFITGSVAALLAKPQGGDAWLRGLRDVPFEEAAEALTTLPGIGPKVAACICLFSLDKHEAIPVDTHVWDIACRYYTPHLRGKSLTKKIHGEVQAAFVDRFGSHAGWAHNTLFISELASTRERVPALAAAGRGGKGKRKAGGGDAGAAGKAEESDSEGNEGSSSGSKASAGGSGGSSFSQELQRAGAVPVTPPEAGEVAAGGRPRRRVAQRRPAGK